VAHIVPIKTFSDARGNLSVIEKELPFRVARIYFLHGCGEAKRGGHRHLKTVQALVCVAGSCTIFTDNGREQQTIRLDRPEKLLILPPEDWHTMEAFTPDCVLLVLASEGYDPTDYVHEGYRHD
jgi:dTDP-4-dehydrorhamnose 3,5-epimerase-like enzyme